MKLPYRLVDVFSTRPFLGNPVAVILDADGLSTEQMMTITRWMNLSETTFLLPPAAAEADYRARIFTLDRELPFAGHPTLGSCAAWLSAGNSPAKPDCVIQECGAGLVNVRAVDRGYAFAAPPLLRSGQPKKETIDEVCGFLRIDSGAIEDIAWIDNGPGWLGIRMASARDVLDVRPRSSHPHRIEVGLVGPCPDGAGYDFEVRALFSDQHGAVREDPVTGSLNAAIAQWLLASGQATAPYIAGQGRVLGREGRIAVSESDGQVWIGGATHVVVSGELTI
jgi:PhzF family phenazine biosynthesis protein